MASTLPQTGRELPRYKCHKEVRALKIAKITPEVLPPFTGATCRGSYAFGTACGTCEHCKWELQRRERGQSPALGAWLIPADDGWNGFYVTGEYMAKHKPEVGGYFVQYDDGYTSFSPAKAFEDGYTRL
jgi:hypothetical protein